MDDVKSGVQCYPVPPEYPQEEVCYDVTANGQAVGIYSDVNGWDGHPNFGYFGIAEGATADVKVTAKNAFKSVELLPESLGITPEVDGRTITFSVSRPGTYVTLVFDGQYRGDTLHLFSNPIDGDAPERSSATLFYFGPGFHDLNKRYGGKLVVKSGQTAYIAAGAVVKGQISVEGASGAAVKCYGMLLGMEDNEMTVPLNVTRSSDVEIGPLLINQHRSQGWCAHVVFSNNVTLDGYKVVSTHYASTDGLDITNSQNVTVRDSFIRACDDAIAIKGNGGGAPADCDPDEHIHISDTILWNDCNNAMGLGAETKAKYYRDITFKNIDVLFSFDDKNNHEKLDERSVMNICCLHGTYFSDILFEDIRVNNCQRLIGLVFRPDFWFGSLVGDQTTPGGISNVVFRNITDLSPGGGVITDEIRLEGWDESKTVSDITFENVTVRGSKVTESYDRLKRNGYVKNLNFR